MAIAVAERLRYDFAHDDEHVQLVTSIEHDARIRSIASRFIGTCLTRETVNLSFAEDAEQTNPIESLYDALQLAAEGDEQARNMVRINVATDVIERTTKSGHVMKVSLDVDEAGRIQQFGQSMESVHANSLRYASNSEQMLARTKAETTNAFRIAEYRQQGLLDDYSLVVFSRAADDMSESEMRRAGFFVDTMSMAIQVTSATGQIITTESAFVAGKTAPGSPRHDAKAVERIGEMFGVNLSNKSATELLETPILVHDSVIPNGVIDIVRMYDEASGHTFFGEAKPRRNYFDYLKSCKERELRFDPVVDTITQRLISEAHTITDRIEATKRLHQLSQDHMVQQAVFDTSIDPKVFGPAAKDISEARYYIQENDYDTALLHINSAKNTAFSSSCPDGKNGSSTVKGSDENGVKNETGDCEFVSKRCPKCDKKNVKTIISKGVITGSCGCKAKLS